MIKLQELRIGNLFWDIDKTPCYYAGSWQRQDGWISRDSAGNTYKELEMHPIPLTPEILEKCGFVGWKRAVSMNMGYEGGDIFFGIPDGTDETLRGSYPKYKHNFIVGCVIGKKVSEEEYECSFWYGRGPNKGLEIKYLHQLQNLYHSLTQTELSINL
jgi:hypothetical protein